MDNTTPIPTPPPSPVEPEHKPNWKKWLLIIVAVAILSSLATLVAAASLLNKKPQPTPTPTVSQPTPTPDPTANWKRASSTYCGIAFLLPPDEEPYYELINNDSTNPQYRRFWQVREVQQQDLLFTYATSVMHVADIEASGFISGAVTINCATNTNNSFTQPAQVVDSLFLGYDKDSGISVKSRKETTMWDKNVVEVQYQGGMFDDTPYYFLVTPKYIYRISKRVGSTKDIVKTTANQIFDSLTFTE